ncbi:sensor histidine kinase [Devosia rhizoryzae]|uniref:Signal transduction histidine kinase subgroup 3 dimerisation and phosphoacceptor domain-containing protein n=1 Tax=Devosia rhizoryzae TaxID=2774137 RepID=A0ABX7C873_9HYPH|nr:histidine kinase [Devosia rhizoryzae]QQR40411.1 hypothetical protein JI748_05240 [Devosia rhizoryzae]
MIDDFDRRLSLRKRWMRFPYAWRFIATGIIYTLAAMVICAVCTTIFLSDTLVKRRGGDIAAMGQRILSRTLNDYAPGKDLPEKDRLALDALMSDQTFAAEFPYLDIWSTELDIIYSNISPITPDADPPAEILQAFEGFTSVKLDDEASASNYTDIFFPWHDPETGDIAAAVHLREVRSTLQRDLDNVIAASWFAVATIALVVMLGLFLIVLEGNRTLERQRSLLARQVQVFRARTNRFRDSKDAAEEATRTVTRITERYLRNIGRDLHDGPAQSIGYAVLKLDGVRSKSRAAERSAAISEVEAVLGDAMAEVRAIAMSLVLPEIENLNIAQVIDNAVGHHLRRTGANLAFENEAEPLHLAGDLSVCVYRFVQEGLNNAFKHGIPASHMLSAKTEDGLLKLSISNLYQEGESQIASDHVGIGLYSLRTRVQSLDGTFSFVRSDGLSRLDMWLPLKPAGKSLT